MTDKTVRRKSRLKKRRELAAISYICEAWHKFNQRFKVGVEKDVQRKPESASDVSEGAGDSKVNKEKEITS